MLKNLSVTNFKCWKKIDRMEFAPITGLFGTNSSGKTSLLQLLLMLKQTVQSADRAAALIFGGDRAAVNLGAFRDIAYRHQTSCPVGWRLEWGLPKRLTILDPSDTTKEKVLFSGKELGFEAEVRSHDGRLMVSHMAYTFAGNTFLMREVEGSKGTYKLLSEGGSFEFRRPRGRPPHLPSPVKCYGFPDEVRAAFRNAEFLADLQLEFEKLFQRIYYLGPLREYPQRECTWAGAEPADMGPRGGRVIDALLAARKRGLKVSRGKGRGGIPLEEYVATWLKKLGLIHEFHVEEIAPGSNLYRVTVRRSPSSPEVPITGVGFGVSQVLPALVLCNYVPEGSTILLEHPDIQLHPSAQAGLADVFIDAVKRRRVQIILESHSEHLLQRLQRRVAEGQGSGGISNRMAKLYFCDVEKGETRLVPLALDLYGNIANWPKDFFGDRFGEVAAKEEAALQRQAEGK